LRTPLTTIIGWSQRLRSRKRDEATMARGLEIIERHAKSQAQLVEDILDVSRVITGKLRLNIGPVDVAAVINAAIDAVQLAADSRGIHLAVTLDPSARRIAGDSSRLQQILWNLLSNAIKFTPTGGRVEVRLERAGSNVQISVSDTGAGISAHFLPFIFDRFRQADGTSTRSHNGLGLGLAIVRHLVELHGGTVQADSPGEGCGATFTIRIPQAVAHERAPSRSSDQGSVRPAEATNAQLKPLPSLAGVQVLLVDDDPDTLQILTETLGKYGAKVQAAASAAEALEALQWYKPDVLVTDLAMPGEDGYSLIGKVRACEAESGNQMPAVALTAYVRVEDRVRTLLAGFNMFVPKPVEPNELIAVIANLAEPDTLNG
ncbi:MAG: ATP-binding protein, partial [Roseiflexaceae bacterium]